MGTLLAACSKQLFLQCPSFREGRLSHCTINETFCSSEGIGASTRPLFFEALVIPRTPIRYAFRSTEKVALQEIGPRFTLKLRWLKKGIPAVRNFGEEPKPLEFDVEPFEMEEKVDELPMDDASTSNAKQPKAIVPPKQDEFLWAWKVRTLMRIHHVICFKASLISLN